MSLLNPLPQLNSFYLSGFEWILKRGVLAYIISRGFDDFWDDLLKMSQLRTLPSKRGVCSTPRTPEAVYGAVNGNNGDTM